MTVTTSANRVSYTGDGTSTVFSYPFYTSDATWLYVYLNNVLQSSGYTVSGVGNASGGNITFATAPSSGVVVAIVRYAPLTQLLSITDNQTILGSTIGVALDKLTIIAQQISDSAGRTPVLGLSDVDGSGRYNANGNKLGYLANAVLDGDAVSYSFMRTYVSATMSGTATSPLSWTFTGNGSTTAYPLTGATVTDANAYFVTVAGVFKAPGTDYSISGTTLTFVSAPASSAAIAVRCMGYAVPVTSTPSAASSIKGNQYAYSATAQDLSFATVKSLLAIANTDVSGLGTASTKNVGTSAGNVVQFDATTGQYPAGDGRSITNVSVPKVRQTVYNGPVDSNGFASFGGSTGSTTLTQSGTLSLTAAAGAVDYIFSITNPQWTGLSVNGTMYRYVAYNPSTGAVTTGVTTSAPNYQWGGTYSTTNGQHTYNIQEGVMKVGDGSAATQVYRVFVGEVTVSGGVVTAILDYALNGRYDSGWTATLPAAAAVVTLNHNLGQYPRNIKLIAECTTADVGYSVGDEIEPFAYQGSVTFNWYGRRTRNTIAFTGPSAAWLAMNPTTGGSSAGLTAANWKYRVLSERGW